MHRLHPLTDYLIDSYLNAWLHKSSVRWMVSVRICSQYPTTTKRVWRKHIRELFVSNICICKHKHSAQQTHKNTHTHTHTHTHGLQSEFTDSFNVLRPRLWPKTKPVEKCTKICATSTFEEVSNWWTISIKAQDGAKKWICAF